MAKQCYQEINFGSARLEMIETIDGIVNEYIDAGYRLTVRQLYYQLVARGVIENTERSYKNICVLVNDARMAGMVDWDAIEDRTREFIKQTRWSSGGAILKAAAGTYHEDMWVNQKRRVFVIVEKEALAGVLERVCQRWDVPLLAARGYPSGTVLREFAEADLRPCFVDEEGEQKPKDKRQTPIIIHLGDHDPSGIDMSRDLSERLYGFTVGSFNGKDLGGMFKRVALNMDQIRQQKPPENPAKVTDSRFESYRKKYGDSSWELDALKPDYLDDLVDSNIRTNVDMTLWRESTERINAVKKKLAALAEQF